MLYKCVGMWMNINLVLLFFAFAVLWRFHGETWQDKHSKSSSTHS